MARFIDEIRKAPRNFRQRVHALRLDGTGRVFRLQVGTLERAESLLDRAPDGRVTSVAGRLVERGLNALSAPGIEGYDELNARDAIKALADVGYLDLLKVQRWERAHKGRKTVLEAVDRQLGRFKLAA